MLTKNYEIRTKPTKKHSCHKKLIPFPMVEPSAFAKPFHYSSNSEAYEKEGDIEYYLKCKLM